MRLLGWTIEYPLYKERPSEWDAGTFILGEEVGHDPHVSRRSDTRRATSATTAAGLTADVSLTCVPIWHGYGDIACGTGSASLSGDGGLTTGR